MKLPSKYEGRLFLWTPPTGGLQPMKVRVVRQSQKTGGLTIELMETQRVWGIGEWVHVKPFELKEMP